MEVQQSSKRRRRLVLVSDERSEPPLTLAWSNLSIVDGCKVWTVADSLQQSMAKPTVQPLLSRRHPRPSATAPQGQRRIRLRRTESTPACRSTSSVTNACRHRRSRTLRRRTDLGRRRRRLATLLHSSLIVARCLLNTFSADGSDELSRWRSRVFSGRLA